MRQLVRFSFVIGIIVMVGSACAQKEQAVQHQTQPAAAAASSPSADYQYSWDVASCERISGWARDRADPDRVLQVELLSDGNPVAEVRADGFRSDLETLGMGTGRYGFSFPSPADLRDGKEHSIQMRISGTQVLLPPPAEPTLSCQ